MPSVDSIQPSSSRPTIRKCRAEYSPALAHLNPTTRATNKPLNSARQSLRSLHFVTLSLRSVGKRCSVERKHIGAALRFAPFAQPAQFHPTIPPSTTTRKCSAEYSPALAHLNPTTRVTNKPLNSARQSLHSLHFVTLSFRSVGKRCSAE